MRHTNILASVFDWFREVIESAEMPFSKLVIFVLPILAPVVPASVTGFRLTSEMHFHPALSFITALVLELIGYVGAIAFIKAIYKKFQNKGSWLSVVLNGLAYGFYVVVMYEINVRLGFMAGDLPIVNQIFALLSFITIPTGLLAAEHLNERSEKDEQRELRAERRSERMEKLQIQANIAEQRTNGERTERRTNNRTPNGKNVRSEIETFVRSVQANEHRTPGPSEISRSVGVSKSYASETLQYILSEQNQN